MTGTGGNKTNARDALKDARHAPMTPNVGIVQKATRKITSFARKTG